MIQFLKWLTEGNGLPQWAGYLILLALILAALVMWYRVSWWIGRLAGRIQRWL